MVVPRAGAPLRRSASGSVFVAGAPARVAHASRIWVEGIHGAELIERIWGHDLRVAGIVVEPLHGADNLREAVGESQRGPGRRLGILLDHVVSGSKESRLAGQVAGEYVEVVGHPFVDVWQAIKPSVLGMSPWPAVPKGTDWKTGVIQALGLRMDEREAWIHMLGRVRRYGDLEPALLGRVEQLIDFVTQ